jgi:uncharacterized integral membrane protein
VWIAAVLFAVVLLLLLIFILQNGQRAKITFFGLHGNPPVGVSLLLAAVFGVLLVALPGTARIVQLRVLARRRGQIAHDPATAAPQAAPQAAPEIAAPVADEPDPYPGAHHRQDVERIPDRPA